MQDGLRHQVVKGARWAFLSSVAVRACQMLTTLVLAKLLVPGDFGLFTLVSIVTNAMTIFPEIGFARVLIYRQGDVRETANTAFTLSLATGALLAGLLISVAEPISRAFNSPGMASPVRVMALSLLVSSAAYVPMALLDKELKFKKAAFSEIGGWIVYAAVSITLAAAGHGVWSLVIGYTAMTLVSTVITWIVSPWRPRIQFRLEESRVIVGYGKHLVVGVLAAFIFLQIDKAAVGKWIGVTALGFYGIAFTVCSLPATNLTSVVNRVMFPTYSKLHENTAEIRRVYLNTVRHLSTAGFLAAAAMIVLPGPVIGVFYGPKWAPAIPLFTVFAFYGLIRTIGATADAVFMATGNPAMVKRTRAIQLAIGVALVYPAARGFGMLGVGVLFTFAYLAGTLYGLGKVRGILGIGASGWLDAMKWPAVSASVACAAAYLSVYRVASPAWTTVVAVLAVLLVVYGLTMFLLDRAAFVEIRTILAGPKQVEAS